jgi:hypothetical protein
MQQEILLASEVNAHYHPTCADILICGRGIELMRISRVAAEKLADDLQRLVKDDPNPVRPPAPTKPGRRSQNGRGRRDTKGRFAHSSSN